MYVFDERRCIKNKVKNGKLIIYWMRRDFRLHDNWSLIYALNESLRLNKKFFIYIFLNFSNTRKYKFIQNAINDIKKECKKYNFSLALGYGDPHLVFSKINYCKIITDVSPLFLINFDVDEVDAHNVVPIWIASNKKEYSAHTIRKKINKLLNDFLKPFPKLKPLNQTFEFIEFGEKNHIDELSEIAFVATYAIGMTMLKNFIKDNLDIYESDSILSKIKTSHLSPLIHFGIISTQRCILEVIKKNKRSEKFIDEMIIRKELADNFCYYSKEMFDLPKWCIENIIKHKNDKREIIYTLDELENSLTNDPIWNEIQKMMVNDGFVLNYLRMYWAKKIAYWVKDIKIAVKYALYLNDKYFLDGEDCIGITNILWCLTGLHDRPFKEREILGKVRYFTSIKSKKILKLYNNM